jgi:hypothetical protein
MRPLAACGVPATALSALSMLPLGSLVLITS